MVPCFKDAQIKCTLKGLEESSSSERCLLSTPGSLLNKSAQFMVLNTDKDLNVSSIQLEQSQKCWRIPAGTVTECIRAHIL